MKKIEEIKDVNANEVLSLLFISMGSDAVISLEDIDDFYKELGKLDSINRFNKKIELGINIPMRENYDTKLFEEIKVGDNSGKFILKKVKTAKALEIQKMKLTKHFFNFVGNDQLLRSEVKELIKSFGNEKITTETHKENLFNKVKGLVIRK